jgi:hypothetical protein
LLFIYIYIYTYIHTFNVKVATTLTSVKQTVFPEKKDELNKEKNLSKKHPLWCIHHKYIYISHTAIVFDLITNSMPACGPPSGHHTRTRKHRENYLFLHFKILQPVINSSKHTVFKTSLCLLQLDKTHIQFRHIHDVLLM